MKGVSETRIEIRQLAEVAEKKCYNIFLEEGIRVCREIGLCSEVM